MEVKEFRFLNIADTCDTKFEAWSRIYEYPYVLETLKKLGATPESLIHNTSWGFDGCHVTFKNALDEAYPGSLHSDIRMSNLPNTMYYDITQPISDEFKGAFDFVLNISTVEEVPFNNIQIIKNLLEQLRVGGHLVLTFDVADGDYMADGNGSMNVGAVEEFVCSKINDYARIPHIRGSLSKVPNNRWAHLRVGVLVIQKTAP
jgi:hypothetical protein